MPQAKRRKLSWDEQEEKESERNRTVAESGEGGVGKQGSNDAGTGRDSSGSQRTPKNEKKGESALSSSSAATGDDGKEGTTVSSGDVYGRVSSSGRVIKQTNKGRCFTAAREAALNKQSTPTGHGSGSNTGQSHSKPPVSKVSTPVRGKRGRKRRSWDLWSKFEQDAFFEGLFEHGKDFDAIHNLLAFRSKKRGIDPSLIKTKEQVRYLYYRMWQKISKHVHMGDNVKKETQEIYGLVNYYTIRKIFKRIDERAVEHLNELIHTGVSKVRDPGVSGKKNRKKVRILRTPVCNALKKLNNIEDSKEEFVTEMPQQVTVELTPKSSAAWLRVHNLSQNPRVRFQVSVNRSLSSLMEHLHKKWKGPHARIRDSLGGDGQETDEMVIFPHHAYTLQPVTLAPQRATSVDLITFSSYKNNVLNSPLSGNRSGKKVVGEDIKPPSENSSDAEGQGPADSTRTVKSSARVSLLPKLSDPLVQVPRPPCDDENAMFPDAPLSSSPAKDVTDSKTGCGIVLDSGSNEATWVVVANCDSTEQKQIDPSPETSPQSREKQRDYRDEEREGDMRRLIETATKGFTRETCNLVSLAQLSLVLGKTAHIKLEYDWRPKFLAGGGAGVGIVGDVERLTNMLRRLSNMANLEYRDIVQRTKMSAGGKMSQCTLCGHPLDKTTARRKTSADASTETDPLTTEVVGGVSVMHPAKLNSNGTLVGMSCKSNFINSTKDLTPDTDGVFRVPMPINVSMSIRSGGPQRMSTQPTFSQLIRPPESGVPKTNFMIPRKRKPQRKPVIGQRTLLPKIPSNPVILVPHSMPQNMMQSVHSTGMHAQLQPGVSQEVLQNLQSVSQQSEVNMGAMVSSAATNLCIVHEVDAGVPMVSSANLLADSSADLFGCNLDMPVMVPSVSSPVKSTQQLIHSNVSPPSLSSILDLSLPGPSNQAPDAGDKFLDMVVNGNTGFSDLLKSEDKGEHTVTVKGSEAALSTTELTLNMPQHTLTTPTHTLSTPPPSPQGSPIKSGAETQWLSEAQDISLSGFLSSPVKSEPAECVSSTDLQTPDLSLSRFLVSPIKKSEGSSCAIPTLSVPSTSAGVISSASFIPAPPYLFSESSQDSLVARLDMETAIQSVMMESSIDYSSKFEKLAEHLADNTDASQPNI